MLDRFCTPYAIITTSKKPRLTVPRIISGKSLRLLIDRLTHSIFETKDTIVDDYEKHADSVLKDKIWRNLPDEKEGIESNAFYGTFDQVSQLFIVLSSLSSEKRCNSLLHILPLRQLSVLPSSANSTQYRIFDPIQKTPLFNDYPCRIWTIGSFLYELTEVHNFQE